MVRSRRCVAADISHEIWRVPDCLAHIAWGLPCRQSQRRAPHLTTFATAGAMLYTRGMSALKVIVISGLPGSGKSTLAESIAQRLLFPMFSVDPIESSIIKSGIARSFETGLAAYFVAETLAEEQLRTGLSVIIDAVNPVKEARGMWRTVSTARHAQLILIECVLDRHIHQQRIENRVRGLYGIPEVEWEDVENQRREYQTWEEERLVLDTSSDAEANLLRALEYIRAGGDNKPQ